MTYTLANPLTAQNLIDLLNTIIDGLIRLAIPITVIIIIWAGVLYIISAGSDRIKTATNALTYAVLGFGIILISSGIIAIIQDFLGAGQQCTGASGTQGSCAAGYLCDDPDGDGTGICVIQGQGPSTFEQLIKVLTDLSGWLFAFAIIAGVAMIIVSGFAYIFARGDTSRAGRALQILLYSIIGVAVAALAWSIINIVANFLTGKQIFATLFNIAVAATIPTSVTVPPNAPTGGPNTLGELLNLLSDLTGWMFTFIVVLAVGAIIVGGFMYLFSFGDSKRADTGLKTVMYAIVGIAIAGFAWALINVVGSILFGKSFISTTPAPGPGCSVGQFVCSSTPGTCYNSSAACQTACGATPCLQIT
ncbi:MAG: hypothetical protein HY001_01710 [Candidatus Portnoybacteria bacterium]|nr:hypothetical protein [Candidatus Portnoybacteria bacterium]